MSLWEDRYQSIIAPSRAFNAGEGVVMICNNRCRFRLSPPENHQFYIPGLAVATEPNVLHIDPTVSIPAPNSFTHRQATKPFPKKMTLFYSGGFEGQGGQERPYYLKDIFIQAPSKTSIRGKRYPLEVCLVHESHDKKRYVVACTPMIIDPNNETPTDPTQKGLYQVLMALANDFPSLEEDKKEEMAYSVREAPQWSPQMFYPRSDQRAFFNWLDPKSKGKVAYILFYSPHGMFQAPQMFYDKFLEHLVKGKNMDAKEKTMRQKLNMGLPAMPKDLWMYVNENISAQPIETRYKCESYTVPEIEPTTKKKETQKEEKKPVVKTSSEKGFFSGSTGKIMIAIVVIVILLIIALLYWGFKTWRSLETMSSETVVPQ